VSEGVNIEAKDFRSAFAKTASTFRKRNLFVAFVFIPLILLFWYAASTSNTRLLIPAFIAVLVVFVLGNLTLPKLICPSCHLSLETDIVQFCPECGCGELVRKEGEKYFLSWPRCRGCGKELARGRAGRRAYLIKFCTRCGVYLDQRGIKC
jgi:hypothetical protein